MELRLARGSDVERGLRHLQLASERLREMQVVARRAAADSAGPTGTGAAGSGNVFGDVLAEHDDRVRAGGELVLQGSQETRSAQPLLVLQTWSDAQSAGLTGLAPDLPESARQRVQTSLQLLAGLRAQATGRLPQEPCRSGCASPPPATAPGASSPPPVGTGGTALGRSGLA